MRKEERGVCVTVPTQMQTHMSWVPTTHLQDLRVGRLTADMLCHLHQGPSAVHSDKAHGDMLGHSSQWCCIHQLLSLGVEEGLSPRSLSSRAPGTWPPAFPGRDGGLLTLASGIRALMSRSDTRISHTILSFSASGAWPGYSSCHVTGRVTATPPPVLFSTTKSTHRNSNSSRGLPVKREREAKCLLAARYGLNCSYIHDYPNFTQEKTEAQRLYSSLETTQQKVAGLGSKPKHPRCSPNSDPLLASLRSLKPLNHLPPGKVVCSPACRGRFPQTSAFHSH